MEDTPPPPETTWHRHPATVGLATLVALGLLIACLGVYGPYVDRWTANTGSDGSLDAIGYLWFLALVVFSLGIWMGSFIRSLRSPALILQCCVAAYAGYALIDMLLER